MRKYGRSPAVTDLGRKLQRRWRRRRASSPSAADCVGSSHVRWKAISLSLYTARTEIRSIDGLKFRGSTITCPMSGMLFGAIFFQSSAFGSSGSRPVTRRPSRASRTAATRGRATGCSSSGARCPRASRRCRGRPASACRARRWRAAWRSRCGTPPRNVQRLVRFAGAIGCPHSSFSSAREGPSAAPSVPWHLWHSMASNISLPRLIDAADEATSFGSSSFLGASLNLSAANALMYATRFQRSFSGRTVPRRHRGSGHAVGDDPEEVLVRRRPCSPSSGSCRRPTVKSRGRGIEQVRGRPLAVALVAVTAARTSRSYTRLPAFRVPGCADAGDGHRRRTTTATRAASGEAATRGRSMHHVGRHSCDSQRRGCWPVAS